jgi:hypothetical protein
MTCALLWVLSVFYIKQRSYMKPRMNQDSCFQLLLHVHCWPGGQDKNVFATELVQLIIHCNLTRANCVPYRSGEWVDRDVYVDLQVRQKYNPWPPSGSMSYMFSKWSRGLTQSCVEVEKKLRLLWNLKKRSYFNNICVPSDCSPRPTFGSRSTRWEWLL